MSWRVWVYGIYGPSGDSRFSPAYREVPFSLFDAWRGHAAAGCDLTGG